MVIVNIYEWFIRDYYTLWIILVINCIDGNIDKAIEKIEDIEINEDSFVGLHDEMVFMASEIFEVGNNKYTLRKLLMLATFYDITKCEDIVDVINGYKNNSNYSYFCDIIFGDSNNKGYGRKYEL